MLFNILFALSVISLIANAIYRAANASETSVHRAQTRRMLNMIAAM